MILRMTITALLTCSLLACGSQENPFQRKQVEDTEGDDGPIDSSVGDEALALDAALVNLPVIIQQLNLHSHYARTRRGQGVTIAILDNGFTGLEHALGKRLPPDLSVEPAPDDKQKETEHGAKLAEIVYAVATGRVNYDPNVPGPELLLFNAYGWKNTEYAFAEATRRGVDYILYAQAWEYGGNLDGTGFINKSISAAAKKAVVVTASGNFGRSTYQAPVSIGSNQYVKLPHQGKYVRLKVNHPMSEVKISLGWNDFKDDFNYRTAQDLDLEIYADPQSPITGSALKQDGKPHAANEKGYSAHARESTSTVLEPGTYLIAIKANSNNFDNKSRLWITAYGQGIEILDRGQSNSVMIPGDNPNVLTIGASDADFTSYATPAWGPTVAKPDLTSYSRVSFDNGVSHTGSSSASAIVQGVLAAMHTSSWGDLDADRIKALIKAGHFGKKKHTFNDNPLIEAFNLQLP